MEQIFLSSPHMSEEGYEMKYIQEAFASNWIAPAGKNIDEFEREITAVTGTKAAVALSSGTAAIHMALKAAGVEEGDIVFCQSLTFSASANPIIYQRAIPVFIDSDYETWNMNPSALLEGLIKYSQMGKKPKAVIVTHLYGLSANLDALLEICRQYDTILIEDAAESLGTLYRGKYTGTLGEYGIYSFNGNKIITASGGGMLISDKEERIRKVKFWATQSKDPARHYEHSELGYNYRLSNIMAGIGRGQLKVLQQRIAKKKYIFEYYQNEMAKYSEISFMPVNAWNRPNYWLTCIRLEKSGKPLDILLALEQEKIEARPIWKPMHLQPFYRQCDYIGGNVAETIFNSGLCLPSDTKMQKDDLKRVCDVLKNNLNL